MMPLFGRSNDKSVNYKARLEHKLYLARENPDPVFDLSDCDLKSVPSGVYSLCKVFRKESLLLQKNNLSSLIGGGTFEDLYLLQVLDLRSNQLSHLPEDLKYLTSLKELYLNNNYLKTLPECLSELKDLRVLNCSFNKLKKLPLSIGNMSGLEVLHLQGNPALCALPDTLALAQNIAELTLDIGRYIHPPNSVVMQGTFIIMDFLAKRLGVDYTGPASRTFLGGSSKVKKTGYDKNLRMLEERDREIQEEKLLERLCVEREMSEQKEKESQLQSIMKLGKNKLMEDILKQETKIAEEYQKFQSQKEIERSKLIQRLHCVEEAADQFINQMLATNSALRQPARVLQQQELDRAALEKLFNEQSQELRRKEVLCAMESLLAEERMQREKIHAYELAKAKVVKSSLSRELEWSEEVDALLSCRSAHQSALVASIAAEERDQVVAVATLLERNDLESVRLRAQLQMVEKQLLALTSLELHKNSLNITQLQSDLSEKRTALSFLLVDILNQQQERKKHLLQTLIRMEHNRWEDADDAADYWLKQYQKLLDLMPMGFIQGFDTRLVHQLVIFGAIHCLPFLGKCTLETLDEEQLFNAGVLKQEDRISVLKAVLAYYSEKDCAASRYEPSAPSPSTEEPSAPPQPITECVVCLNDQCEMVFVPCGHLCCCLKCSEKLSDCPLCRSKVERKIRVISP